MPVAVTVIYSNIPVVAAEPYIDSQETIWHIFVQRKHQVEEN